MNVLNTVHCKRQSTDNAVKRDGTAQEGDAESVCSAGE